MPLYFIDTSDGHFHARDEEGSDLPHVGAARRAAVAVLMEIAKDHLGTAVRGPISSRVRDRAGTVVFEASLALSEFWMILPPADPPNDVLN